MPDICGNIKAELETNHEGLTALAQLVAVYTSAGIISAADISKRTGYSERAIRKAKAELGCRNPGATGTPVPEPECHDGTPVPQTEPECRNPGADLAHAHDACVETPSGLLIPEVVVLSPPPPKSAAGPTPTECLSAFEAYNSVALRCGLPQASKLTPKRAKAIRARVKEFGPGSWERALANLEQSKFLCGETKENFRADLDFVCQAKSFARLHDGGYGNGRHVKSVQSQITVKPPEPDWLKRQRFEREILEINGEV